MKKKKKKSPHIGILRTHPRGFGFVKLEGQTKEVFIPPPYLDNAIDEDVVAIEVDKTVSEKGPSGKILEVIERSKKPLAGIIVRREKKYYLAYVPTIGKEKLVALHSDKTLKKGDRILLKLISQASEKLAGMYLQTIGSINNPQYDVDMAIVAFNIRTDFPKKVYTESKKLKKIKKDLSRKNLTQMYCITIDPDEAQDYDDALSLSVDDNGNFHLGVHIADVAHYIKPNMALDQEAYVRGNSTYLPGRTVPMLPFALSHDLCSLQPDVEKLCQSVFMDFDKEGNLTNYEIFRTMIKSKKRLTYSEASALIKSCKKSYLSELLKNMEKLCLLLKDKRHKRGSIDFSIDEAKVLVDDQGKPLGIKIMPYDISHQLVEEFMLKANEVVASHLKQEGKNLIFRIHEQPLNDNFEDFISAARALGFSLPDLPSQEDIQELFHQKKSPDLQYFLSILFIRNMKLAFYSPTNAGHYGLALENYCHFTSPIRRYNDLIIQRLLFDEQTEEHLSEIANTCSANERKSFQAESFVIALKKLRLLKRSFRENPKKQYFATITQIKPFGFFFELQDFYLEGFLHLSDLHDDYYIFEPHRAHLRGERSSQTFAFGDQIKLQLKRIDLIFQKTYWKLLEKL